MDASNILITDLVSLEIYADRFTLVIRYNWTPFNLIYLLLLVNIIFDILNFHWFIFWSKSDILLNIWRLSKLSLRFDKLLIGVLMVMIVFRMITMISMAVPMLSSKDSIDQKNHHIADKE